jgi:hypothetical protein
MPVPMIRCREDRALPVADVHEARLGYASPRAAAISDVPQAAARKLQGTAAPRGRVGPVPQSWGFPAEPERPDQTKEKKSKTCSPPM